MFNCNSTSKQQLKYFHVQTDMRISVKMASSRPCGSIGSIISDVPSDSNSCVMCNELNETSDTLVSISKEGKS